MRNSFNRFTLKIFYFPNTTKFGSLVAHVRHLQPFNIGTLYFQEYKKTCKING